MKRASLLTLTVALTVCTTAPGLAQDAPSSMVEAARSFLATLEDDQRGKAMMPFDGEERFNFHYTPVPRQGLPLNETSLEQRRAAHALLRSGLSSRGYLKATSVMQLEQVLREIEQPGWTRDRALYYVSVFGTPAEGAAWGWRFEGHHLSLNYTSVTGELTASTPAFFGANPAEVRTGPTTGLRVLAAEEDLARRLMADLDAGQRARAVIAESAPRDIITSNDREANLETYEGLSVADMTPSQRDLLWQLIREYTHNMRDDLAERQIEKIRDAGFENLYFAWAGSLTRGEGHYYRIHGPTVLFEYDNTQNDANHIHAVWRDLEDDFGEDLLRRHYEAHAHD